MISIHFLLGFRSAMATQILMRRLATTHSDVYSFGIVVFEAITGTHVKRKRRVEVASINLKSTYTRDFGQASERRFATTTFAHLQRRWLTFPKPPRRRCSRSWLRSAIRW